MIIISNKPGQLGNLLFIYANFLAYGIENNLAIVNPSFYEYRSYFASTSGFSFHRNKLVYSACYVICRVLSRLNIKTAFINVMALDWSEEVDLEKAPELKSTFCFVQGWLYRSERLLTKHRETIKDFFKPSASLNDKLNDFFYTKFSDTRETIIGIHIRRGDYKTFENGAYYYSMETYAGIIKQLSELFKDKNPHFLICSNESVNLPNEDMTGIKMTSAPNHELLDMYALARCHYIAGPPSTYSMWASFYDNTPLYMIKDPLKNIDLFDFNTVLPGPISC
jgi:hypothetical protein